MNDFNVDWNDHIGEFIRLKATQPQVLAEMLRRQQYHSQEKEIQSKLRHLQSQHDEIQSQLSRQNSKLEALSTKNAITQNQICRMEADCSAIEHQLQRSSKQLQIRHKTKSSRSSLDGTNNTSSESSLVFLRHDLLKKVSHESLKHELEIEVQKAIARKVSLKEEIERFTKRVSSIQETVKKNIKIETTKEEIRKIRPKEEKLKQQKCILIEWHKSKLLQLQKPGKLNKIQQGIVQQSFKRLQTFIKQTRKIISNQKTRNSKKAQDFLSKYSRFNDYLNDQKQLNRLVEKSPELRGVQYNSKLHQLGNFEELQNQMLTQLGKKDVTTKDFRELEQQLRDTIENCNELKTKQAALDRQIQDFREDLQKKKTNIYNQKTRIKSCRSI